MVTNRVRRVGNRLAAWSTVMTVVSGIGVLVLAIISLQSPGGLTMLTSAPLRAMWCMMLFGTGAAFEMRKVAIPNAIDAVKVWLVRRWLIAPWWVMVCTGLLVVLLGALFAVTVRVGVVDVVAAAVGAGEFAVAT